MNNYPAGAEFDPRAPYNQQPGQDIEEISVWTSNTLSKNVTLEVENCGDIKDQISQLYKDKYYTAKEALDLAAEFAKKIYVGLKGCEYLKDMKSAREDAVKVFNACEGWEEDEFEVVLE